MTLLRNVEVDGQIVDVRLEGDRIEEIGVGLRVAGEVLEGNGGALLPGLHDHHIHLYAAAAAIDSTPVGPPAVLDLADLERALRDADRSLAPDRWVRAIGYHESVAGDLERAALDALLSHRPVRVQHRTGARWTLNSAAIDAIDLERAEHAGIERDAAGTPTGRLHRADDWLRTRLPEHGALDLAALGARLAAFGVTGVTDTTPFTRTDDLTLLADAVASGALPQLVTVTGGPDLTEVAPPSGVTLGPVKVVIDDASYPSLDDVTTHITRAHRAGRNVAVHCVTRAALVLALAAWDAAGSQPGDRVEHGAVVPPELVAGLHHHRLTVVTQAGFVAERGDEYLADVDPDDVPYLYPCRTLLDAGVPVAASTDAPFTALDPWTAMRAAVNRRSPSGNTIGEHERVDAATALRLFLGRADQPGGPARTVRVGARADLCLLDRPLAEELSRLRADDVIATISAGRVIWRR